MNCNELATILDQHRAARLTPAERCAVDEHIVVCADCAAAWHADAAMRAIAIPAASTSLPERVQAAIAATATAATARPRRVRSPWLIGGLVAAGAALAATTFVTVTRSTDEAPSDAAAPPPPAVEVAAEAAAPNPAAPPRVSGPRATSVEPVKIEFVNTSAQPVPFLRIPPNYPPDALAENLQGNVIIESTVTATGEVADARVVESTDPRLAAAALNAFVQWKYLPRIVAGKRVATEGVHTTIRFQTAPTPTGAGIQRALDPAAPGLPFDSAAFGVTMMTAWQRVIADDLRGAELALDEFRAMYALPPFTEGEIWNAYAYVYTLQGNYDRAIDAYESAIAVFASSGSTQGRWVELANLYFARNQYDLALNTLLRPQRATNNSARRMTPEAEALLEKLRALGITEETVPAR